MRKLSFLLYSEDPTVREQVSDQLTETGRVRIQATVSEGGQLALEMQRHHVDGIYLDVDRDPEAVFTLISELKSPRPMILLGGEGQDREILLRALHLGVRDFFVGHKLDMLVELLSSIEPVRGGTERPAPILAVVGAKGGVGSTTIACELAVALEEAGTHVLICDLNLRLGDVPLYFDMQPANSISDIAKREGAIDAGFVEAVVVEHASNVSILAAPSRFEDLGTLNFSHLDKILDFFQSKYDCIVMDIPWGFDEFSLRSMSRADKILLVTTTDVPSLTHTKTRMELLTRFGTSLDDVHVVVNRLSDRRGALDQSQIASFLECAIDVVIIDDTPTSEQCMNEGKLLRETVGGEKLAEGFYSLRDNVSEWCGFDYIGGLIDVEKPTLLNRVRSLVTGR
ncbi:MAG: AAA family ATPase [Deltaproteobacteria bacterium]|nr:AAA family ATPase [Deltaproteobacteria bacterium]